MRYVRIPSIEMTGDLSFNAGLAKVGFENIPTDTFVEVGLKNPNCRLTLGDYKMLEFPMDEIQYISEEFEGKEYNLTAFQ